MLTDKEIIVVDATVITGILILRTLVSIANIIRGNVFEILGNLGLGTFVVLTVALFSVSAMWVIYLNTSLHFKSQIIDELNIEELSQDATFLNKKFPVSLILMLIGFGFLIVTIADYLTIVYYKVLSIQYLVK